MFKGIRGRLVSTYILLTIIAIVMLEAVMAESIWQYYIGNIRDVLIQQAQLADNFFKNYMSDSKLEYAARDISDDFAQVSNAEVQVMNSSGVVLGDSIGNFRYVEAQDIKDAKKGKIGTYQGDYLGTGENVMAVSSPLLRDGKVVGVVRFVTSLGGVEDVMHKVLVLFIETGIAVVALVAVAGILISGTLTRPLKEITAAAEKISGGDFKIRLNKRYDDEVGRLAETLNQTAAELGKLDAMKNDFISSISHEIRTPLTSIKGWSVTLKEGADKELLDKGLGIIEKETDRLTVLVNSLLDFSRLQSDNMTLAVASLDLKGLIDSTVDQMRPRAQRLGISIATDIDDMPPIKGDFNRLKQVLINILDNSLKFTDSGGSIDVHAQREADMVSIVIKDTGQGIPRKNLDHITEKFYTAQAKHSGSGIGLAISKEIIELHGGKLSIKSKAGVGTSVTIELPAGELK